MDFALLSIILGHFLLHTDAAIVSTSYGLVRGDVASYPDATGSVKSVRRFLGIPYASPPVKELRFKAPEPPQAWKPDTYDARHYRNVCPQTDFFIPAIRKFWPGFTKANFSEDCLYLNVFSPAENASSPFPVMVYIHGGGYLMGTPVLNPSDQLVLRGVVVVTFQYRLGPLGFISTGDSAAPGNFGMLDQVQALRWVKENIEAFGGDPTKVTIFGLSAGSSSVALQLLSPLSKNLFQRAISESGVELSPWALHKTSDAARYTRLLAKKVGCEEANSKSMVECLRSKPSTSLNDIGMLMMPSGMRKFMDNPWSPVVDGRFLPDTPRAIRKSGTSVHRVPYLAGFTRHEGSIFLNQTMNAVSGVSPDLFKKYMETYSEYWSTSKAMASVVSSAFEFEYTPWPDAANSVLLREQLVHFITDTDYTAPTMAVLSSHSAKAPCYMYLFSHVSRQEKVPSWMGTRHGDSLAYIFGFPFMSNSSKYDDIDRNVSRFMMMAWTNFAKTGAPTAEPTDGVEWTRFNSSNLAYLEIAGSVPKMERNYRPHQVAFWNWYVPKLQNTKFDVEPPTTVSSAARLAPPYAAFVSLLVAHFTLRTLSAVHC